MKRSRRGQSMVFWRAGSARGDCSADCVCGGGRNEQGARGLKRVNAKT